MPVWLVVLLASRFLTLSYLRVTVSHDREGVRMETCRCGCGSPVAPGKQWVRGHNMRALSGPMSASAPDPPQMQRADQPPYRDEDAQSDWWNDESEPGPLTYDQAAEGIPDDPDPARMPAAGPVTTIVITRAVRRDIEGKVAFGLMITADLWGLRDPYCANALEDNADKIARRMAPLLCQSPAVVEFFIRQSGFMLAMEFAISLKPVLAAMFAHHITKTVGTPPGLEGPDDQQGADWSAYTAA